jgi:hypothetical protein
MAVSRAEKRTRNRQAFFAQRLAAARRDELARLHAAYIWYCAELSAYTAAGGNADDVTAKLAASLQDAAARLSGMSGRRS